ncbi:MAG: nuclear transport factor 2 family protein [Micromonosporaceae bacterium]
MLAVGVRLHSPAKHRPFEGRDDVLRVLIAVSEVFEDFRYVQQLVGDQPESSNGTAVHGLVFRARIGDKQVHGIDLLEIDAHGQIIDLTVMIRPITALIALAEAVNTRLNA